MNEIKKDLEINVFNLDTMLANQPILYMHYQEQLVDFTDTKDILLNKLNFYKNEYKKIRASRFLFYKNRKDASGKNPTDKYAEMLVDQDSEVNDCFAKVQDIQLQIIQANKEEGLLFAAVKAFEQRKKSLEKLTDLCISGYYSSVKQKTYKKNQEEIHDFLNQE